MKSESDLTRVVQGLTDAQTMALLRRVNRKVFDAISVDEVHARAQGENEESDFLLSTDPDTRQANLDSPEAIAAARSILRGLAADKSLAQFVDEGWKELSASRELPLLEVIIPLGLMINLAILLCTTEIKLKNGKLEIKKGKASASLLRELLQPVVELAKRVGGQA